MKVKQINSGFKPIQITLENQKEIDAICTLVNSVQITKVFPILDDWHNQLDGYGDFGKDWDKLKKILKK